MYNMFVQAGGIISSNVYRAGQYRAFFDPPNIPSTYKVGTL
jgi:hypothetical protein